MFSEHIDPSHPLFYSFFPQTGAALLKEGEFSDPFSFEPSSNDFVGMGREREGIGTRLLVFTDRSSDLTPLEGLCRPLALDLFVTSDHQQALAGVKSQETDLVFIDSDFPSAQWKDLLRGIRSGENGGSLPILLIISSLNPELRIKGLEAGVDDFIGKPLLAEELRVKIRKYREGKRVRNRFENLIQQRTAQWIRHKAVSEKRAENLKKTLCRIIHNLALSVETREPHTIGHQKRTADLSWAIGQELGLASESLQGLLEAAKIHDLGKITIPLEILTKPAQLSKGEFDLIKLHPEAGAAIVEDIEFSRPVARMIMEHHERIDGSGYPKGLTGKDLLPESRILAVADVVEAISSYRPYRRHPFGLELALEEIEKNRGLLYEAQAVDACLRLFREKGYRWK